MCFVPGMLALVEVSQGPAAGGATVGRQRRLAWDIADCPLLAVAQPGVKACGRSPRPLGEATLQQNGKEGSPAGRS